MTFSDLLADTKITSWILSKEDLTKRFRTKYFLIFRLSNTCLGSSCLSLAKIKLINFSLLCTQTRTCLNAQLLTHQAPGLYVVIIFTHGARPSVHPSVSKTKTLYSSKTKYATRLRGAWWVTLKSPELIIFVPATFLFSELAIYFPFPSHNGNKIRKADKNRGMFHTESL